MSGLFITVEGIECVGKSTNTKFISNYLNKKGIKTHTTREPAGTLLGETTRHILLYTDNENLKYQYMGKQENSIYGLDKK